MGANAEGKISLSVELANFKDIAGNLKKGITKELKEIPLDINFNDKKIEEEAAKTMNKINELLSKGKITNLDFSEILPSFISTLKKEDISDEIRLEVIKGFESALSNLKDIGVKFDYDLLKLFDGQELKTYLEDLNNIVDVINSMNNLSKRQKEGLLNTIRPKDFPLTGKENRGKVEEYTKGAKKINGILQLKDKYSDVVQYATSPDVTSKMIEDLSKKTKLTKADAEDYLGYLLRAKYLSPDSDISQNFDTLIEPIKKKLKEEVIQRITDNSNALFKALDEIYDSSNAIINYSDLFEKGENTTNSKYRGMYDTDKTDIPTIKIPVEDKIAKSLIEIKNNENDSVVSKYEEEISKINTETEELESKLESITNEKKKIEQEINQLELKDKELTNKIDAKKNNEARNKRRIFSAKQNIQTHQQDIESFKQQINNLKEQNKQFQEKLQQLKDEENTAIEEYGKSSKEIEELLQKKNKAKEELLQKINRSEGYVENSKQKIAYYDEALKGDFSSKGKDDAWRKLKAVSDMYRKFEIDPDSFDDKNKDDLKNKLIVSHYKALLEAKKQGVAEGRISKEIFATDDIMQVQIAEAKLEQKSKYEKQTLYRYQENIATNKKLIEEIEKEEEELHNELKKILEAGFTEQDFANQRINKQNQKTLESQIEQRNSKIQDLENKIADRKRKIQTENKTIEDAQSGKEAQEIQQLEEEQKQAKELLDKKQKYIKEQEDEVDKILDQLQELENKKEELLKKQQGYDNNNKNKQSQESDTNNTENEQNGKEGSSFNIPSEDFQKIIDLLGQIQKALGTLEDGSDIPSITQSIKDMADALKGLNDALGEIKQKDFNLNLGLPNNNPIGQQGEAKRKILKELEQQYNELDSYFTNKYGNDSIAFNALSKLEGGSDYVKTMMSDFSIIGDTNAPLADKINVYKTLIEQLRSFVIQEGGDLNKVISNTLAPDKIIEQINQDILNANPTTAISKLFENMQVSINASLAKINSESQGFNFLTGSAEEAAEAKRKFVEANKEVLQSIIGSIPRIEQEVEALEKVEEVKFKADDINNNLNKNESNKEDIKQQQELLKQEQLQIRAEQEREKIQQKFEEIQLKRNARLNEQRKQRAQDIKDRIGNRLNQPSAQQIAEAQLKEQQKIQQKIQEQLREDIYDDYSKSQEPQYNYEPDYDDLIRQAQRQAQEVRQIYEEEISKEFEIQVETKLNLAEDSTGQLSLFDDILPEKNWGQTIEQEINSVSQAAIEGQISFQDLENAINNSEKTFAKLMSPKTTVGKSFIQNKDLPNEFLKQYEDISTKNGKGYKATSNLRELKNLGDELANIKTKLKVSFDEAGNLKSFADPFEIQSLLERYDELTQKIQRLKLLIESPNSQEFKLLRDTKEAEAEVEKITSALEKAYAKLSSSEKITTDTEKLLNPFVEANIPMTESIEQMIDSIGRMRDIHSELASSFDFEGKLIGDPKRVQSLITEYNNLSNIVDELKTKISSPTSEENIVLKMAKDAKKAQKELENLKSTVDKTLGKTNLFEARTQKTIDAYGAYEGNGEGKKVEFITPEIVGEKYGENFKQQQIQVQELIKQLGLYKTAVEELRTLRLSDETTVEQLTQANEKVKALEQNITTLSQTIKTSGIANATETQIEGLRTKFETLLKNAPNLTKDVKEQIQEYIQTLSSGATVSKTAYNSMSNDLRKFSAEQTRGSTIWEQMVGKMREGVAFLATKFSFYQIFNQFRQGFEVVHQFDDALTEMMKVSDETRLSLERYQKTTFDTADAIGTNALQIQNSTADFMRLGETLNEAAKSAKAANILMNVSEFQSIDEATKSLIAMGAAYDDLSKMNIIDKLNQIGNNFAISTSEAATALQASASALTTANNDMDEALALITAGNAVVQDATKVGIKDAQR